MADDPFTAAAPRPSPVPPRPSRPAPPLPVPVPALPTPEPFLAAFGAPLPATPAPARADKMLGGMLPPPPLEPAPAPAPSLSEQQVIALRAAFEQVLIRTGSSPPPPAAPRLSIRAAKAGVAGTATIFKSVGALVLVILPVLSQLFPKYFGAIWDIVSALRAAP